MKKRILFFSFLVVMIAGIIWIAYWIGFGIYEGKKVAQMYTLRIQQREDKFRNNPNLLDCLVLLDTYYWELRQYEKALYYGEYCIRLNVEGTRRGWYVHMLLADIYRKDNKNLEKACYHIRLGLEEAKRDNIDENHIKELKLQNLIDICK